MVLEPRTRILRILQILQAETDADHETVTLLCDNRAMNTVIDHFGSKVKTTPVDKDHFQFDAEVSVSPTFFSWIFEFGGMIRIIGPEGVKNQFHKMMQQFID